MPLVYPLPLRQLPALLRMLTRAHCCDDGMRNRRPGAGDHDFHIWKLVIKSIFFLDYYGGMVPITVDEYFAADPNARH